MQLCELNATDKALCEMPVLNLPSNLTSSNDTRRDGLAVSTLRTDNEIANLYIGFVFDDLPSFRNISKSRPHISFSLSQLQVSFPPPGKEPFQFDPSVSKYLIIKVLIRNTTYQISYIMVAGPRVSDSVKLLYFALVFFPLFPLFSRNHFFVVRQLTSSKLHRDVDLSQERT